MPSSEGFPKSLRLLRSKDFRQVYDEGERFTSRYFSAFRLKREGRAEGPRIGFTTPRALGKAVLRNRMKRKVREAVRRRLRQLPAEWDVVINPRRASLEADAAELEQEVARLFLQCGNS